MDIEGILSESVSRSQGESPFSRIKISEYFMSKFSVKKPFTVLVMVVVIVILGIVSVVKMQLDLLPEISLPYLIVVTTYPGASPERVEAMVCEPMESELGTISGVKNVVSVSNENYGLVELEFQEGTDLDSAMVKVSSALDLLSASLPDECGVPSIIEISTDMMATQYLAIGYEGMTIEELSRFSEEVVVPSLERQDGVASVSSLGLVEKTIQVELNKKKVDALNDKILGLTDDAFADAVEQLDEAKKKLEDSEVTLNENRQKLIDSEKELEDGKQELLDGQAELDENKQKLNESRYQITTGKADLEEGKHAWAEKKGETERQLAETETQLLTAKTDLEATKMHLTMEITTLQATNAAYQENLPKLEDGIGGANAFIAVLTPMAEGGYGAVPLGMAGMDDATIGAMNLVVAATGGQITADMTVAEAIEVLESAKSSMEASKNQMTIAISTNQLMISQYQASMGTVDSNLAQVNEGLTQLYAGNMEAAVQLSNAATQINLGEMQLASAETSLESGEKQLESAQEQIDKGWESLEDGEKQIAEGWKSLKDGEEQIADGWEDYYDAVKSYEKQKAEALKKANANDLISLETLAGLVYAQNFSMPAGYVDDVKDNAWLVKVGDHIETLEELQGLVLCNIKDIGDISLTDVADITVIDNSLDSYTRLNGEQSVILSVFKASTAGTNNVSKNCKAEIERLKEEYPKLSILVMMDQGDYINLIIGSVLQSMIIGAALAIIILAIFLKDLMPTLVVALSIPLSVLAAMTCMYFSKVSLNMMSLSGLALGIGMLVDNSVVVIENVYRLRSRGVSAPRAAVHGTGQVAGAIVASTLTTVCVFVPMVYTTGLVNELMMPMCLAIIFCLMASLLVAMTVVPAAGATLLKNTKAKAHPWFDKIQDLYGVALRGALKVKIVPLSLAIVLLAITVWQVVRMGIVMIPDMTSSQIQANMVLSEDLNRAECYARADDMIERILKIEGIDSVGVMTGDGTALFTSMGSGETDFRSYSLMVVTENEDAGYAEVKAIVAAMEAAAEEVGTEEFSVSTGMSEMSGILGSGLSVQIYGDDLNTLLEISEDIMDLTAQVEGYTNISNGAEDAAQVLHLEIDKNKAMSLGLPVAQIFQELAGKMTLSADAVTVTVDGMDMNIQIRDEMEPLTKENLLDYPFTIEVTDDDGDKITEEHKLGEFATVRIQDGVSQVHRENQSRYMTVTAEVEEGYNTTLLTRQLQPLLDGYEAPDGYKIEVGGEYETVVKMIEQMALVMALGLAFIYLVMVAQFQSLLSPFIVLFTIPLAFTGGLFALWIARENLSVISLMGFLVLMGTVVNNGIVFVDYTNQLRIAGMERHAALVAAGKTRMRPILMTALTTILAESNLIFGDDMGSQMGKGMALVIAGGLAYATLMTLFIIPVMYDILFKKAPHTVDLGPESLDDIPEDAEEFMEMENAE